MNNYATIWESGQNILVMSLEPCLSKPQTVYPPHFKS